MTLGAGTLRNFGIICAFSRLCPIGPLHTAGMRRSAGSGAVRARSWQSEAASCLIDDKSCHHDSLQAAASKAAHRPSLHDLGAIRQADTHEEPPAKTDPTAEHSASAIKALVKRGAYPIGMRIKHTRIGLQTKGLQDAAADAVERVYRLMNYAEEFEDRWFWETDAAGRLTYLSKSVADQIEPFDIKTIGEPLTEVFKLDQDDTQHLRSLNFHLVTRTAFSEYAVRGVKGLHESWWCMSGRPWFDAEGTFCGFVGSGTDLTKARRQEATIKRLALTDSLTALANREQMREHLERLLSVAAGDEPRCALMMLDLDGFKVVNDTLGHPVGDALLVQVAQRLTDIVGEQGIVGRLGGDEFQILVPGESDRKLLLALAQDVIDRVSTPYSIINSSITISCSVGIALPDDTSTAETLVRNADIALYAAKAAGRSNAQFFEEEMLARVKWRKKTEDDLRTALASGQMRLLFQPIVSTHAETLNGFEALLRWTHPSEGEISPCEFIPIAESSGLIQQIGDWVIREAARVAASLPDDLRIAVNVSPLQFKHPSLVSTVASAIADNQIDPSRLELEITESVFLENGDRSQRTFAALQQLGVRLALDDFGTGYSSLSYLQHAPFNKIKIDQGFVRGAVDPRSRNSAIIGAIVELSKALGMETTAEGVEYQDEVELIRKLGCSHIQGYVYGPASDLTKLIPKLWAGKRKMKAIGPKRSRDRRTSIMRRATLRINETEKEVLIRNMSQAGAMIEDVFFPREMVGVVVTLDLQEDRSLQAIVRWVRDRRAGLQFSERIDFDLIDA